MFGNFGGFTYGSRPIPIDGVAGSGTGDGKLTVSQELAHIGKG